MQEMRAAYQQQKQLAKGEYYRLRPKAFLALKTDLWSIRQIINTCFTEKERGLKFVLSTNEREISLDQICADIVTFFLKDTTEIQEYCRYASELKIFSNALSESVNISTEIDVLFTKWSIHLATLSKSFTFNCDLPCLKWNFSDYWQDKLLNAADSRSICSAIKRPWQDHLKSQFVTALSAIRATANQYAAVVGALKSIAGQCDCYIEQITNGEDALILIHGYLPINSQSLAKNHLSIIVNLNALMVAHKANHKILLPINDLFELDKTENRVYSSAGGALTQFGSSFSGNTRATGISKCVIN